MSFNYWLVPVILYFTYQSVEAAPISYNQLNSISFNLFASSSPNSTPLKGLIKNEIFIDSITGKILDEVYPITKIQIQSIGFPALLDFENSNTWINATMKKNDNETSSFSGLSSLKDASDQEKLLNNVSGKWSDQSLTLQNINVPTKIGVVTDSKILPASLGLGMNTDEATDLRQSLFNHKLITDTSFGITITPESYTGQITFGKIDSTKYSGSLASFRVSAGSGFSVPITAVSVGNSKIANSNFDASIEYDKELIHIPKAVLDGIISQTKLVGTYDTASGVYQVDCSVAATTLSNSTLTFLIQKVPFTIPLKSLVLPIVINNEDHRICGLSTVTGKDSNNYVLGTNFLQYVYEFVDYDDFTIKLGQLATSSIKKKTIKKAVSYSNQTISAAYNNKSVTPSSLSHNYSNINHIPTTAYNNATAVAAAAYLNPTTTSHFETTTSITDLPSLPIDDATSSNTITNHFNFTAPTSSSDSSLLHSLAAEASTISSFSPSDVSSTAPKETASVNDIGIDGVSPSGYTVNSSDYSSIMSVVNDSGAAKLIGSGVFAIIGSGLVALL